MPLWTRSVRASRILARLQDERGIALIMAIGIMFVLTITVSSVMVYTAASAGHANNSNAGQKAYALAEAGVNNALAVLNANYPTRRRTPATTASRQTPPPAFQDRLTLPACTDLAPFTSTPDARGRRDCDWWGRFDRRPALGTCGVIRSTGSVPNPTGPGAAPVTRTLTVKVPMSFRRPRTRRPAFSNWLYSATDATALNSWTSTRRSTCGRTS